MKGACTGIAVLVFMAPAMTPRLAHAQSVSFEELSRRAGAALQSNPQQAADLYRQALALQPSWAEGWFYLGASLSNLKQNAEASKAFERASVLAPENGAVWAYLGLTESELGHDLEALADIRKAESFGLPNNPKFVSVVRNRAATLCLRSRNFDGAVEQLRPLTRMGDNSPDTLTNLGVAVLTRPYLPPAIPADQRSLVQLAGEAMYALYGQQPGEGRALFEELVQRYPAEPGVHYLRGIYLVGGDPDAARAEFRKELQITPSHLPARLQIAIIDLKGGNADSAATLARQVLLREPANPLAHAILGRAFSNLGQYPKAIPELETAIRSDPGNPQLHFALGQAYHHVGRDVEARKEEAEYQRLKALKDANAG